MSDEEAQPGLECFDTVSLLQELEWRMRNTRLGRLCGEAIENLSGGVLSYRRDSDLRVYVKYMGVSQGGSANG